MIGETPENAPRSSAAYTPLSIAVVLRTKTNDAEVFEVLDAIDAQSRTPKEIVLIDSGSSTEILAGFVDRQIQAKASAPHRAPIRIITIPPERYQSARTLNEAIETTSADLIAILSQDATPIGPDYLDTLATPLERNPRLAGAYGRQVPRHRCAFAAKDLAKTYTTHSRDQSAPDCWFVNTCSMVRRDLWVQHPFSEEARISEDHEWGAWAQSQGYLVRYEADAVVLHSHPFTGFRTVWRRHYEEGRGLARVGQRMSLATATISALREMASDILWFLPNGYAASLWRSPAYRLVKNYALWNGLRQPNGRPINVR